MRNRFSISESCFVDDVYYQEGALLIDLEHHDATLTYDLCQQEMFLEDGEETEPKSKSILANLINKVLKILANIGRAIQGFFNSLKPGKDGNLTAEKYFQSETGKIELDENLIELQDEIDDEYLKCRKMIQKISKATHIDDRLVAMVNDTVSGKLHQHRRAIVSNAKAILAIPRILQWKEKTEKKIETMQEDAKALEKLTRTYQNKINTKRNAIKTHEQRRKERIKDLKQQGINYKKDKTLKNDPMLKKIGMIEKLSVHLAHLSNQQMGIHRKIKNHLLKRDARKAMLKYT